MVRLLVLLTTISTVVASAAAAQPPDWKTVQQAASWYSVFVDQGLTRRSALWFDGQWRRMGLGESPQQLLLRPGVQFTLTPGVRVATGYAYIATAPYGEAPSATPLREHRSWQQLSLAHRAGALSVTHRYRWEQRWLAPLRPVGGGAPELAPFQYQQRARYMVRGQGELPLLRVNGRPLLGFVLDELLMPVGHADATARLAQNRIAIGVGVPIDARQRVEVGYMNLWNALSGARTNEVNHTLSVSWVWVRARNPR